MSDEDVGWREMKDEGFIGLVGPIFYRPGENGAWHFRLKTVPKHKNRAGFVHGGMLATLADRAMGTTARGENIARSLATVQLNIQYIAAVRVGETVDVKCTVLSGRRSLIFVDSEMKVASQIVVAASGVWKIIGVG